MKKIFYTLLIMAIILSTILVSKVNAASLDNIQASTNKEIVNPGDTVVLTINFGKPLGAYTFDIAYDNNLLEYVETDGGTPNDNGTRVRVVFYDSSGGTGARESMTITFRAKTGIQTSNPTDLSITAEGLANPDASENYDDIVVPITKNITVEPNYEDYKFDFTYTGNPIVNEEKEMNLSLNSSMGRFYDHARILVEAQTPDGGNVQLLGTDEQQAEHDLIDSGWGDPSGFKIGGQVNKVLKLRGIFDKAGEYTLTFRLIDRDNSDAEIAKSEFKVTVDDVKQEQPEQPEITPPQEEIPNGENSEEMKPQEEPNVEENLPQQLPKTGANMYIPVLVIIMTIISIIAYMKLRNKKN